MTYCKTHRREFPKKLTEIRESDFHSFWNRCPECQEEKRHLEKIKKMPHVDNSVTGLTIICPFCEEDQGELDYETSIHCGVGPEGREEGVYTCGKCEKEFYVTGAIGDFGSSIHWPEKSVEGVRQ